MLLSLLVLGLLRCGSPLSASAAGLNAIGGGACRIKVIGVGGAGGNTVRRLCSLERGLVTVLRLVDTTPFPHGHRNQ